MNQNPHLRNSKSVAETQSSPGTPSLPRSQLVVMILCVALFSSIVAIAATALRLFIFHKSHGGTPRSWLPDCFRLNCFRGMATSLHWVAQSHVLSSPLVFFITSPCCSVLSSGPIEDGDGSVPRNWMLELKLLGRPSPLPQWTTYAY
jgi:hypothetical protein